MRLPIVFDLIINSPLCYRLEIWIPITLLYHLSDKSSALLPQQKRFYLTAAVEPRECDPMGIQTKALMCFSRTKRGRAVEWLWIKAFLLHNWEFVIVHIFSVAVAFTSSVACTSVLDIYIYYIQYMIFQVTALSCFTLNMSIVTCCCKVKIM